MKLPDPPKTTDEAEIRNYRERLIAALRGLKGLTTLSEDAVTASAGYVQAEAQATMNKVDAVVDAINGL